ncbi:hypothetical protein D9611_008104 [Ephemerocybe angulata]|uniref:Uncharacterized protein n=1 Tax=Ephemerocybe angulata TaxID=980116 RepID=A0A8H5BZJ0_9AGAR|nr:hypothetical protein D9611_008104 [Tulosesus angulatus]
MSKFDEIAQCEQLDDLRSYSKQYQQVVKLPDNPSGPNEEDADEFSPIDLTLVLSIINQLRT